MSEMNFSLVAAAVAASNALGECIEYLRELGETDPKAQALAAKASKTLDWHDAELIADDTPYKRG